MKPWRELIAPHKDVLSGTYQESEFAADLSKVVKGEASPEYQDPVLFFERTYITEGMRLLLNSVVRRLSGRGGDPVIQLKTAFGGGKTHTLLAVHHIACCRRPASDLAGVSSIIDQAGVTELPQANIAVIDGNNRAPSQPLTRDGQTIKTMWGEMAYQIGKAEGFGMLADADADGTSPGKEIFVELFTRFAPCVILLDELVAYIRQFEEGKSYAGGTFESNLSFLQALTEAASQVPTTMVLASLPESELEAGGERGKQALANIEKIFGRVEAVWKPVATTEGFEIVRRRLFGSVTDTNARDAVCRAFAEMYVANGGQFPSETNEAAYLDRLKESYPIHPEVFERLYGDWSTLERFQRTRGVLRLMAMVIHCLWRDGNQDLMIMPGSLPLYDSQISNELIRYLPQGWEPVIERDVDGKQASPVQMDAQDARLGSLQAAERVARTIFLGSAPGVASPSVRGVTDVRARLGCVQPGQQPGIYDDALRRLLDQLHYLFTNNERNRFWYDTRPNLRREMEDRMSRFQRDDHLLPEIQKRLRLTVKGGVFSGVHVFTPHEDIPDDQSLRLVVLTPPAGHRSRSRDSIAIRLAAEINVKRGAQPRTYQNRLVYLAADEEALQQVFTQTKRYLSWDSIVSDSESGLLNLDQYQRSEAKQSRTDADARLSGALKEAFRWILTPAQEARPRGGISETFWEEASVASTSQPIVEAIAKTLADQERLILKWSPIHLRSALQTWFWADDQPDASTQKVWKDFCSYPYLPRLVQSKTFEETVAAGIANRDFFAYAAAKENDRYTGLIFGTGGNVFLDANSLLVRPEAAAAQLEREQQASAQQATTLEHTHEVGGTSASSTHEQPEEFTLTPSAGVPRKPLKRFHGRVTLNPVSMGLDAAKIAEEIVQHFTAEYGTQVTLTLEIEAFAPNGINEKTARTTRENARSLGFQVAEFETD